MEIRLRFYRERGNMDENYYSGNDDVRKRVKLNDLDDLKQCWGALIHDYEGETYSAWLGSYQNPAMICGGAFDPCDIITIEQNYNAIMGRRQTA